MTDAKPLFEHEPCTRCCGTGHYSYNTISGTKCFKCHGQKYSLTKRGRAAQDFLEELRKRPAAEVKVGDLVWFDMHYFKCCTQVTEITQQGEHIGIYGKRPKNGERVGMVVFPNSPVRMGETAEQKEANRAAALAYQATLTKAGKPRKTAQGEQA